MYRRLTKAGVFCALALGLWMATPEAQAQRRGGWGGGWGGGRGGWGSPGISFGVDRGGFYAGPSSGRYGGWDGYGRYGYGGYGYGGYGYGGYGSRFWDPGWYSSYSAPRYSYYSSPGYYTYPSTTYYSAPAVTYSPSTTYSQSVPSTTYSAAPSTASSSRDTAHIRVHVPDPSAQLWVNDAPTQQRGTQRVFETPPLRSDRTNTYEVRAKWQDEDGRTMEQTRTVRVQPGAHEVITFGQAE